MAVSKQKAGGASGAVPHLTVAERAARGKAARAEVPRASHAVFAPPSRRIDPSKLLERQAKTRVPELVPMLDSVMLRAPRPTTEAMGMEMRIEDGREHLRDGLADQPIHRSRHPQRPQTSRGLGDRHPPDGLRPVSARVER